MQEKVEEEHTSILEEGMVEEPNKARRLIPHWIEKKYVRVGLAEILSTFVMMVRWLNSYQIHIS